jgi:hypothetical protein
MKEMFKKFIVHSDVDDIAIVEVVEILKKLNLVDIRIKYSKSVFRANKKR